VQRATSTPARRNASHVRRAPYTTANPARTPGDLGQDLLIAGRPADRLDPEATTKLSIMVVTSSGDGATLGEPERLARCLFPGERCAAECPSYHLK
jgi:hypothetical protein